MSDVHADNIDFRERKRVLPRLWLMLCLTIFVIPQNAYAQSVLDAVDQALKDATAQEDTGSDTRKDKSSAQTSTPDLDSSDATDEVMEVENLEATDGVTSKSDSDDDDDGSDDGDDDDEDESYTGISEKDDQADFKAVTAYDSQQDSHEVSRISLHASFRPEGLTAIPARSGSLYLGLYKNFYTVSSGTWEWGLSTMFPPGTLPFMLSTVYGASPTQLASSDYKDYVQPALYMMTLPWPYFKRTLSATSSSVWAIAMDISMLGGYRILYSHAGLSSSIHVSIGTTNVGPVPLAWHAGLAGTKLLGNKYHLTFSIAVDHRVDVNPARYLKTLISGYAGVRIMDTDMYADFAMGMVLFLNGDEDHPVPDTEFYPVLVLALGWR